MRLRATLVVTLATAVSCASPEAVLVAQAPPTLLMEPGGYEKAVVERAVDGDTIEVTITGRVPGPGAGKAPVGEKVTIRLLGIDTPESVDPRRPVECFGEEAAAAAAALLEGQTVVLVKDTEEVDAFGRLLRYVYLGHEMANARLVINGYAASYPYAPNVRHSSLLKELQRRARTTGRGLWAEGACGG
ncbi:MAG: thermonuclease family protein [Actinomycetota bacterium]